MNKLLTLVLLIVLGGYSLAFIIIKSRKPKTELISNTYCEGWKRGVEDALAGNPKTIIYKMPECQVPNLNDDNYDGGYRNGFRFVLKKQLAGY